MSSLESTATPTSRSLLWRYLPLLGWMIFIAFASSASFSASSTSRIIGPLFLWFFPNASGETLTLVHMLVRKLAHFVEYAVLGLLAARAFRGSPRLGVRSRWFLISAGLIVVYSLVDEYRQSFVPSRTPSIFDSLVDMAGGLTSLIIVRYRASGKL
jgi:VanZ family protein